MSTAASLPLREDINGFLKTCTYKVARQPGGVTANKHTICPGGGLLFLRKLEELHHTNLRKLLHLQLQIWRRCDARLIWYLQTIFPKVRNVTVTGAAAGLVLEMFLDQGNYMLNKLSRKAGARITVHDPK